MSPSPIRIRPPSSRSRLMMSSWFMTTNKVGRAAANVQSDRKAGAYLGRDANGLCGFRVDRDPERARGREYLPIALAQDLDEPLEGNPRRLADPGAKNDFVAETDGRFVIDLVTENDPADFVARGDRSRRVPMRGRDFLDPADVNGVVNVVLPIDVRRLNRDRHFERRRGLGHATL